MKLISGQVEEPGMCEKRKQKPKLSSQSSDCYLQIEFQCTHEYGNSNNNDNLHFAFIKWY